MLTPSVVANDNPLSHAALSRSLQVIDFPLISLGIGLKVLSAKLRQVADHKTVELQAAKPSIPYDRLVLHDPQGRTIWTVLSCERADKGWNITAIRCPRSCRTHRRRR
jgi:hypothetical protein